MSVAVTYDHEIPYGFDGRGEAVPRLVLRLGNPLDPTRCVDTEAYLDSGAQRSVFDGGLGRHLGLDLFEGHTVVQQSALGITSEARLHRVSIEHAVLGAFQLEVAFTTSRLHRNVLGRDFFNFGQIGFMERQQTLLFNVAP